ncbi:[protein release factor]-glutamine N5-methyltransferase [Geoalkalibacter ferrihydriticus]|uniref:Release factor glutamine methyltransferase n=2 Tax=Geoalkalibacter ferrihydriticus TaxID=392333 RepID=A0A0C2EBH4_9BACT|nr:peptide chain release factor N(5)-glutamine methyltransferase [Geoalkalibacter ferrihydriticus]KIH75943.1 SAM-dependent methyltransferase [Geoalkalibacter ferrihydriticus DSM 17813]SDM56386.1 [protein release factor]-glutamine N5-methyltransferase [Geoalkalibacter ferrihydriticus]
MSAAPVNESWTVLKVLEWTAGYFRERGIESARLDADLLLAATLEVDRVGLYLRYDQPLQAQELSRFRALVARRARREPLAYILGEAEFWSLSFKVSSGVLIPRPDTEVLVEEALACGPAEARVLDVGTGSGALAVALVVERPAWQMTALDVSNLALEVATGNAARHGVRERIRFLLGDLAHLPEEEFDLIIANPPYIPSDDLSGLMADVRDFEPHLALDGGADGLAAYRALASQAPTRLSPGGWLLVEIGQGQEVAVTELFQQAGLGEIHTRADYAGIIRVVGGRI